MLDVQLDQDFIAHVVTLVSSRWRNEAVYDHTPLSCINTFNTSITLLGERLVVALMLYVTLVTYRTVFSTIIHLKLHDSGNISLLTLPETKYGA